MKFFIALFIMVCLTIGIVSAQGTYVTHLKFESAFKANNHNGVPYEMSSGYYQFLHEDSYYVWFLYQRKMYKTYRYNVDGRIKKLKVYNNYHSL